MGVGTDSCFAGVALLATKLTSAIVVLDFRVISHVRSKYIKKLYQRFKAVESLVPYHYNFVSTSVRIF